MIQIQFGKANNAPLGAALAVTSMVVVAFISVLIFLAGRRFGGKVQR
jgi:spermidine/putrescine transport system permease protein